MEKEKLYKPLPKGLTIGKSKVQGLGLFTNFFVKHGTNFGVSHMKINGMLVRTPLGGFVNHSDKPNCIKSKVLITGINNPKLKFDYTAYHLVALKDITGGDELTVKYTFYDMGKEKQTVSEKSQDELEPIVNAPMMDTE
jgi:hypothetical protein